MSAKSLQRREACFRAQDLCLCVCVSTSPAPLAFANVPPMVPWVVGWAGMIVSSLLPLTQTSGFHGRK